MMVWDAMSAQNKTNQVIISKTMNIKVNIVF